MRKRYQRGYQKRWNASFVKLKSLLLLVLFPLYAFYLTVQTFQNVAQWGKKQLLGNTEMGKPGEKLSNGDISQFQGKW